MKNALKGLFILLLVLYFGCTGSGPKQTEPSSSEFQPPTAVLDISPDTSIHKAYRVLRHYGSRTKDHMSYSQYQEATGGKSGDVSSWSPDWFYDTFNLNMNEKDYWITVQYSTAKNAKRSDSRIADLMKDLPENTIDVKLKTPAGSVYLLGDTEADGVLDFARLEGDSTTPGKQDLSLLKKMQEKYAWILGIIKRNYGKIKNK